MQNALSIEIPKNIALSLKMSDEEFAFEFKKYALLKLYEIGKVSSGQAAKVLNISRVDFLELLSKHSVTCFDTDNLAEDAANA